MGPSPSNPRTLGDLPGLGAHSTAVRGLGASDGILRETAMDQTPLWKTAIVPGHYCQVCTSKAVRCKVACRILLLLAMIGAETLHVCYVLYKLSRPFL